MFCRDPLNGDCAGKCLGQSLIRAAVRRIDGARDPSVNWGGIAAVQGQLGDAGLSTTCLIVEVMVSTWGALPSTWMISLSEPTFKYRLTVSVWSASRMTFCRESLNPLALMATV